MFDCRNFVDDTAVRGAGNVAVVVVGTVGCFVDIVAENLGPSSPKIVAVVVVVVVVAAAAAAAVPPVLQAE